MGIWFSTERIYTTLNLKAAVSENGTQTPTTVDVSEKGTQTPVTFTDRLTGYGTKEIGSTEVFDHVCNICDTQEHEAVGFCKQCEQFYCFRCCKSHENIPSLRNHTIVAKRDFTGILDKREKLFGRQIVPISVKDFPVKYNTSEYNYYYNRHTDCSVRCIALSASTKTNFYLVKKWSSTSLEINNPDESDQSIELSKKVHMIVLSETNHDRVECFLTLPNEQAVQKGSIITNPFKHVPYFKTSGECWGIAELDDGFAVSVKLVTGYSLPNWQVQYLDAKGNLKKLIYYDKDNTPLFSEPEYLSSNPTQDTLYVSDRGKHEVIALDVVGNVLFTFAHNELINPRALTVDDEDNVYVACGNSVIQIHKSGTKHRVLLQKNKNNPDIMSVCFNTVSHTLVVGEDSNKIKTFKFLS